MVAPATANGSRIASAMGEKMDLINLLSRMASEQKTERFNIRMGAADREALAKLAQAYSKPMAQVLLDLIRQGIIDYVEDGECLALSKYK